MSTRSVLRSLVFVALAVLVAAVLAGCQRPSEPAAATPTAKPPTQPPVTPAAKAPASEPAGSGPDVNAITLELLDGKKVALADHIGKEVVVIDFWATWCHFCMDYMPKFEATVGKYESKGVAFYSVATLDNEPEVRAFIKDHETACPVAYDRDDAIAHLLGIEDLPVMCVIGKDGKLAHKHKGYKSGDERLIEKAIEYALKG